MTVSQSINCRNYSEYDRMITSCKVKRIGKKTAVLHMNVLS